MTGITCRASPLRSPSYKTTVQAGADQNKEFKVGCGSGSRKRLEEPLYSVRKLGELTIGCFIECGPSIKN